MKKVGGQKLEKRGMDEKGASQVKGGPANGKGGAKIKSGGKGKGYAGKNKC